MSVIGYIPNVFIEVVRMELSKNQSALILTETDDGDIKVDVASSDLGGLTSEICQAIAKKLMEDERFLDDLMDMIEGDQYDQ